MPKNGINPNPRCTYNLGPKPRYRTAPVENEILGLAYELLNQKNNVADTRGEIQGATGPYRNYTLLALVLDFLHL